MRDPVALLILLGVLLTGCDGLLDRPSPIGDAGAPLADAGANPDAGGNPDAGTVDLLGPEVELFTRPAASTTATNPRFEFRSADPSGIAEHHCQLDGQGFTPCQSPLFYAGLALSSHLFEVKARDGAGNWGSASGAFRITYDGAVLVASGAGGALQLSGGELVHAIMTNGQYWGVRHFVNGAALHDYPVKTPQEAHELALGGGYIAYGGYGPIHGITPAGVDVDLTLAPWQWEARPQIFFIGGKPWLASTSFHGPSTRGYLFLRPWGEKSAIVLEDGDAASLHAVELNGIITLAMNDPTGRLLVRTFPIDAPRVAIRP